MPPVVFCGQGVVPCAQKQPPFAVFCPHGSLTVFQRGVAAGKLAGQRRGNCQRLPNGAPLGKRAVGMRCGGTNGAKSFCSFPLSSHTVLPRATRTNKKGFCVGKSLFCASCAFTLGDFVCLSRQASKVISAQCVFCRQGVAACCRRQYQLKPPA